MNTSVTPLEIELAHAVPTPFSNRAAQSGEQQVNVRIQFNQASRRALLEQQFQRLGLPVKMLTMPAELPGSAQGACVFADMNALNYLPRHWRDEAVIVAVGSGVDDAMNAFKLRANRFLSWPFTDQELLTLFNGVVSYLEQRKQQAEVNQLCRQLSQQHGLPVSALGAALRQHRRKQSIADMPVTVRSGNCWLCLSLASIRWIEAAGDYMCVYTDDETHIVRSTLTDLHKRLPSKQFLLANRSAIVNRNRVKELVCKGTATYVAKLDKDDEVKISRRCYAMYWR